MNLSTFCILLYLHNRSKVADKNYCTKLLLFFSSSGLVISSGPVFAAFSICNRIRAKSFSLARPRPKISGIPNICSMYRLIFIPFFLLWIPDAIAQDVRPLEVVINEILFNPVKDGYDYVEGFNRSGRTIDLTGLQLARRNLAGEITVKRKIQTGTPMLGAGGYFVITPNENWLRQHYRTGVPATICTMTSMPSFPNDEGIVVLLNGEDVIIDEVHYSRKWHFPLITDPSGVALERIDPEGPSQDKNNWTSASSSSGYGTPGFVNSHFQASFRTEEEMVITPPVFSPDNDGADDLAQIRFQINEPGYVANLWVFDVSGRRVRYLLKNQLLGTSGLYAWDGLDDNGSSLPQGVYILRAEIFNTAGRTRRFLRTIVLAHR